MSLVMFRRALKDLRWTMFWYALGVFLYSLLIIVAAYPTVHRNSALVEQYMRQFPQAMLRAFGVTHGFMTLAGFLGGEILNFMWPLVMAVFVIMAGAAVVAQEIERGTVELWLSAPESRIRLLTAKLAALVVGILVVVLATLGALALGARLVGATLTTGGVLTLGTVLVAFGIAVGGYTALASSFSNARGKAAGLAAALTLAFYLAWVIAGLSDQWSWLKRLSLFTAYEPQRALEQGTLPVLDVVVLLAIGVVCAGAAMAVFHRRDAIG
jgi:ABC-2 type transport system permease protein